MTETGTPPRHDVISRLKLYLPYVLSAGALVVLIAYLWRNVDRYQQLLDVSLDAILSLLGLVLVFTLINGLINFFFYRALGASLTVNESIGLAAVNTLANQLPFAGGLVAKGVYLKQRHQLAYTHFLSATMALYVCFVAVNGAVALTVLALWAVIGDVEVPPVLLLGFSGMTLSVASLWLPVTALSLPGRIGERLTQLGEGWRVLSQNLPLVGMMTGLQVLTVSLFAARFWIAFHALSQDVTYGQCLLFSSATILTRLVSLLPGGLGVREGIVAGVASVLGFEPGVSVVAVGVDRLLATSVIVILGTIYTYVLSSKATDAEKTEA